MKTIMYAQSLTALVQETLHKGVSNPAFVHGSLFNFFMYESIKFTTSILPILARYLIGGNMSSA